jgi:ABC-type transport system involved in multi-copper enzyme maturation permease subunit
VLKKEFRDTLKVMGQCLLVLLAVPIFKLLDWHFFHFQWEISGIMGPIVTGIIIIFAAYSGATVFRGEKKDRALEYLLSLPVSRWEIFSAKVIPRLLVLLLMVAAAGILNIFKNVLVDGISMVILFLTGLFISLAVESLLSAIMGVLAVNLFLYYASLIMSYVTMEYGLLGSREPLFWLSQLLPAALLLFPLAAAFALTLKNLDVKSLKWHVKPYLVIALPSVLLLVSFIFVFLKDYLTWIRK